jgi:hypothetical protein
MWYHAFNNGRTYVHNKQQPGYASMPTMNAHGVQMPLPERMDTKFPTYAQELDTYSIVMTNWVTESMCKMGAN